MIAIYNEYVDSMRDLDIENVIEFMNEHEELTAEYTAEELLSELITCN